MKREVAAFCRKVEGREFPWSMSDVIRANHTSLWEKPLSLRLFSGFPCGNAGRTEPGFIQGMLETPGRVFRASKTNKTGGKRKWQATKRSV